MVVRCFRVPPSARCGTLVCVQDTPMAQRSNGSRRSNARLAVVARTFRCHVNLAACQPANGPPFQPRRLASGRWVNRCYEIWKDKPNPLRIGKLTSDMIFRSDHARQGRSDRATPLPRSCFPTFQCSVFGRRDYGPVRSAEERTARGDEAMPPTGVTIELNLNAAQSLPSVNASCFHS